jgi:hypothetical protein
MQGRRRASRLRISVSSVTGTVLPYSVRTTGCPVAKSYQVYDQPCDNQSTQLINHFTFQRHWPYEYGVRSSSSTANSTENLSLVRTGNKGRLLIVIVTNRRSPSSRRPQPPAFRHQFDNRAAPGPCSLPSCSQLMLLCSETP